jgi:FkbM family methyltransferase
VKLVRGVWLPDGEAHLTQWAKEDDWRYQGEKLDAALAYVKDRSVAVDVGGHCGLWSKELVRYFLKVVAFEPIPEHRACYEKNVRGNYELHPVALGDKDGMVKLKWNEVSTGDTRIHPDGQFEVPLKRLDDVYQGPCGFLKIDTEGYEEFVLRGATELLKNKPVVIVEQKKQMAKDFGLELLGAVKFLKSLGYKQKEMLHGDYILVHE